ncbi:MAG: serine/threonine protein kinase [Pseudanabaenaceae cyanobacterium]
MSSLLDNRYQILSVLGSGGFGDTFLAEDTKIPSRRRCVIKQLKPVADNSKIYVLLQERFQREAAILEALGEGHPNIPKLYANFSENDLFYLVQEWVDGDTLTRRVRDQMRLPEAQVRHLLQKLLTILEYVHSKGIIHRDIKPENIILRRSDGEPFLIDFGAVKETLGATQLAQNPAQNPFGGSLSIAIGTPGFMASEQSAGRPVYSSDLYSLAVTAVFMLTGRSPQELPTHPQNGELLWHDYAGGVSPGLQAVLDKALQLHPRDRFASAQEMNAALMVSGASGAGAASGGGSTPVVTPTVNIYQNPDPSFRQPSQPQNNLQNNPQNSPQSNSPNYPPNSYGQPPNRFPQGSSGYDPAVSHPPNTPTHNYIANNYPSNNYAPNNSPINYPPNAGSGTANNLSPNNLTPLRNTSNTGTLVSMVIIGISLGIAGALGLWWFRNQPAGKSTADQNSQPAASSKPNSANAPNSTPKKDLKPFFFLADSAYEQKAKADKRVQALKDKGFTKAGNFELTDYGNLRDSKPWTQVYVAQFDDRDTCIEELKTYGKQVKDAYCAYASPNPSDEVGRIQAKEVIPVASSSPSPKPTATNDPSKTTDSGNNNQPPQNVAGNLKSPDTFIRNYYDLVNSRQYTEAWASLSPEFQQGQARGYKSFTEWWNSIDKVNVIESRVVNMQNGTAIVDVSVLYFNPDPTPPENMRLSLKWDSNRNNWVIDGTELMRR